MERHDLGAELFEAVGRYLAENGLTVNRGTTVDATIIDAPNWTKNRERQRGPEMHQMQEGNQ